MIRLFNATLFGIRLHRVRLREKLSQAQLAKDIGTTQAAISKCERGECGDISVNTLLVLAKRLGVSLDYLVGMAQSSSPSQT